MHSTIGLIYDMDGVIVHSNPAHKRAIQTFCQQHNQEVSHEFLHNKLYGRTNKEWIPELFGDLSRDRLKELADEKEQLFRDSFDPKQNIVPGLMNFLRLVKEQGFKMAVATSAPAENADYILSDLNIQHFFDAVLNSSHVSKGKPEPEVYQKASAALSLPPAQCIVFEDSIAGVEAGLRAGCKVVAVTTTHTREEFPQCDYAIDDFVGLELGDLTDLFVTERS